MAGRPPKEKSFANMLRIAIMEASAEGKTKLREIAEALVDLAIKGDMAAIREVADRLDGKPAQEASLTIETRRAVDLTDDELAFIAAGGRERTAEEANGSPVLN